jgi:hypothetical protein
MGCANRQNLILEMNAGINPTKSSLPVNPAKENWL